MAEQFSNLAVLLLVGYVSAYGGLRINLPTARLIGPILAVGFLNSFGLNIAAPPLLVMVCSIVLGINIGLKINNKSVKDIKNLLKPSLIIITWYVLVTFLYGKVLSNFPILSEATAFLAVVPGGIAEVSILALSYHADIALITAFQITRVLAIFLLIPPFVRRFRKIIPDKKGETFLGNQNSGQQVKNKRMQLANWYKVLVIGSLGSIIFTLLHIPAGRILGAIIFTAGYNIWRKEKIVIAVPKKLLHFSYIGIGGTIGSSVTPSSIIHASELAFPMTILTILIIGSSLLLAWVYSKVFKWDIITGFLGIVPGGLVPMTLVADEVDADVIVVSTLQLVRFLTAIILIPFLYSFIL